MNKLATLAAALVLSASPTLAAARQPQPPAAAPKDPAAQIPGAPPAGAPATWLTLEAELNERPFVSALAAYEVVKGGGLKPIHERASDRRLAIGTTAMFFVHSVAVQQVASNAMRWDTPIALDLYYKSWPFSKTLDAPEGTFITLADWTRRMMLATDNTAAEHLLAIFGREALEAEVARVRDIAQAVPPGTNAVNIEPFLTPNEFWKLKASVLPEPLDCYAWSGDAERRTILERDVPGMEVSELVAGNWVTPQVISRVGWHASPRELCLVANDVIDRCTGKEMRPGLDAWRLPGVEKGNPKWRRVWGKLGGEPGVLAGVWAVESQSGRTFLLSIVFNDARAALPEATTVALVRHALEALSGEM
jgi:hypothetical protein